MEKKKREVKQNFEKKKFLAKFVTFFCLFFFFTSVKL